MDSALMQAIERARRGEFLELDHALAAMLLHSCNTGDSERNKAVACEVLVDCLRKLDMGETAKTFREILNHK